MAGVGSTPASALPSSFVVTKTADTNDGVCDADCPLREAIVAANANADASEITFGGSGTIALLSALPSLSADISIIGPATVMGVNKTFNIFTVNAGVTAGFNSLTIDNGFYGIVNSGLSNATLNDNVSANENYGTISVAFSALNGNYAGLNNPSDGVAITDCTFESNSFGIESYAGSLSINNTTLSHNSSYGIYNGSSSLDIINSSLDSNSSNGISTSGSTTIINCTLIGNRTSLNVESTGVVSIVNAIIVANSAYGIYNKGVAKARNTIVAGNSFENGGNSVNNPITIYGDAGQLINFFAVGMDVESGRTLFYSLVGAPEGAYAYSNTGEFFWTPTATQAPGTYVFHIHVTDEFRVASQKITLIVRAANST